jgi:hypothetical protein
VVVGDAGVDVFDDVTVSHDSLEVRLHWLMPRGAAIPEMSSSTPGRSTVVEAVADSTEGWYSPHYAERLPAVSLAYVTTITRYTATIRSRFLATNLRG